MNVQEEEMDTDTSVTVPYSFDGMRFVQQSGLFSDFSGLIAETADPWILVHASKPVSYLRIHLNLNMPRYQQGDCLNIYYCTDLSTSTFSEDQLISIQLAQLEENVLVSLPIEAHELRFDLTERSGPLPITSLRASGYPSAEGLFASLTNQSDAQGLLVVTHELSNTGAPILASRIARSVSLRERNVLALYVSNNGKAGLEASFSQSSVPLLPLFISDIIIGSKEGDRDKLCLRFLRELRRQGFTSAILNTVISGSYAGLFKSAGIAVTTLIHETAETLSIHGWERLAQEAGMFSDNLVFPCEAVRAGFNEIVDSPHGVERVQPQGVYLDDTQPDDKAGRAALAEMGIHDDDILVLGSGTIELRKGTDLFVSGATSLVRNWHDVAHNLRVLWVGEGRAEDTEWLRFQLRNSAARESVVLCPFLNPSIYKSILRRANVFWSTSRSDTFPSVVLEAMSEGVPVLAFRGAGGVDDMLANGRGILVDDYSSEGMAQETSHLLTYPETARSMTDLARSWVRDNLDFSKYVDHLIDLCAGNPTIDFAYVKDILSLDWEVKPLPPLGDKHSIEAIQQADEKRKATEGSLSFRLKNLISRKKTPILLDTSIGTDNIGDQVIMDYCTRACSEVFGTDEFNRVPTHKYDGSLESLNGRLTILCGTNLIYTHMENSRQQAFPLNLNSFDNICMLGVGMQDVGIDEPFTPYSTALLHYLLDNRWKHSVRDQYTKERLAEIGIFNVLNTSCPTMWGLSPSHCQSIPHEKGRCCVTTVTSHNVDAASDAFMLQTLREAYEKVYVWIQGPYDYAWCLRGVVDPTAYTILRPSLSALDEVLSRPDIDYVGVRLHAGIRALNHGRRTLVVCVDNRARHIARDTGLPIIERSDLRQGLVEWIYGQAPTAISLPWDEIETWKSQFR